MTKQCFEVLTIEEMGMDSAVLLVTDVPTLPATVITWAIKAFENIAAGGAGLTVLTNIHQSGKSLFNVSSPILK